MDASQSSAPVLRVPVVIAGRRINLLPVTPSQGVGVQMAASPKVSDETRARVYLELLLSLIPTEEDREYVMMQFASNTYSVEDFALTMKAISTTEAVDVNAPAAVEPKPKTARKTTARKTTARAKR